MSPNNQDLRQDLGTNDNTESRIGRSVRNQKPKQKWSRNRQNNANFTGKTREMNGQVFQLQLEQKKKGQFQETLNQLQIYSSSNYKKDIKHLKILFTEFQRPVIVKSKIDENMSKCEQVMFAEQAWQYIKDSKSLETTLASLYNVVWGQCSRLLQNKLKSSNKCTDFDNNCNVAALLREIKTLSSKLEENTSTYDALH